MPVCMFAFDQADPKWSGPGIPAENIDGQVSDFEHMLLLATEKTAYGAKLST